ncbi:MAG: DUF2125 domain-containing protein [Paracoccus sp. (in: a-proteobacteria)]|uniref:DUF2125 domain-containing protein n=1 Tax=Paracoccus sp. TaxID=267 RepID=UPI0026E0F2A6|nr:DUF2125 domain-containing protein [Paracoccus sp. (in: a-proteobacteria)]MDO5620897.1 DUF2125 domain-containing protein [Paracoccus sp. (in: a-proteobacteria)]
MNKVLTRASVIALLAATPALADLTPAEVWKVQTDAMTKAGYDLQIGNTDDAGQTLTLTDVVAVAKESDTQVNVTMPKVVLQQTGDGNVRMSYEDGWTSVVSGKADDEGSFEMKMSGTMPGADMVASGTPDNLAWVINAPEATVSVDSLTTKGEDAANLTDVAKIVLKDVTGSYGQQGDKTDFDVKIGQLDLTAEPKGMPDKGTLKLNASYADVTTKGTATITAAMMGDDVDLEAALRDGANFDMTIGLGRNTFDVLVDAPSEDPGQAMMMTANGKGEPSELTFRMNAEELLYAGKGGSVEAMIEMNNMPEISGPIEYSMAGAEFLVAMPVTPKEEGQPAALKYKFDELKISDNVWGLFDPAAALKRDPISLDIDVKATVKLMQSLFSDNYQVDDGHAGMADESEVMDSAPQPILPMDVTLNRLFLSAVGATVDGAGKLDFPNPEQPEQPVGEIKASFEGVNGLMDALVSMGVVGQDEIMGVRMMMAMFAKPVDGQADKLESRLEFREGGQIFANGQQIQ